MPRSPDDERSYNISNKLLPSVLTLATAVFPHGESHTYPSYSPIITNPCEPKTLLSVKKVPAALHALVSINKLGIHNAQVSPTNSINCIVPGYRLSWLDSSADLCPPENNGLAVIDGHDDIQGEIFRYLSSMQKGDKIHVTIGKAARQCDYTVYEQHVVPVNDTGIINHHKPSRLPEMALISCAPYWVDDQRVVIFARLSSKRNTNSHTFKK